MKWITVLMLWSSILCAEDLQLEVKTYNKRFYALIKVETTFHKAQAVAKKLGGNIAEPRSVYENRFLSRFLRKKACWLGVNDRLKEDKWVLFTTKKPIAYSNWYSVRMHNKIQKNVAEMRPNGKWAPCAGNVEKRIFIVMWDKMPELANVK